MGFDMFPGVIGMFTAMTLLETDPSVSVLVLDQKNLEDSRSGAATGAGQGYLWMAHRNPDSAAWELASRSKIIWENIFQSLNPSEDMSAEHLEWFANGSLLIAKSQEEANQLQARESLLRQHGILAAYLNASETMNMEPALKSLPESGGSLLVPGDSQLNGRMTLLGLVKACQSHHSRFQIFFEETCQNILFDSQRRAIGVKSVDHTFTATRSILLAAGAWSGEFLARELSEPSWKNAIMPRRGHLVELPSPSNMPPLHHGMMEMNYTKHYQCSNSSGRVSSNEGLDISFTATSTSHNTLLIGSSREFSGWESRESIAVVNSIMQHAIEFLPDLKFVNLHAADIRVGLRPFSATGPIIGPVPGIPGLLIAAGHEGSGLTMAPATAELLVDYILERDFGLDKSFVDAFSP